MADMCDVYTVAGMTINAASGDTIVLDQVPDGLDGTEIRRTIPPRGQAAGAIFLPGFDAHRIVTFNGFVAINSLEWGDPGWNAAQESLVQSWISAIAGITNSPGTLAWTSHSLTVYKSAGPKFSANGQSGEFGKKFILSLYAPDPVIA